MSFTITAYFGSGGDKIPIETEEDVSGFLAYFLTEAGQDADNTLAALYINERPRSESGLPDHEIRVGINPKLSSAALGFTDVRGSFYAQGQNNESGDVPYFSEGHDESFPPDSVVTVELIRKSISEMLTTGERPTDVNWQSVY
ncbi:Imm1 family immunity protein [Kribbella solani]|uniref:Imm1 family immunity protein n=1 Tax=Kribbella solani TaxID=236067 RepID=UPI0029B02F39|nr:Imm1 family immunity protein [Kribbella solani]MDX2974436.1 Imm1 family immunity protein [Kribbella solani]